MNWRPKGWKKQTKYSGDWDNASENMKWEIPHSHGWADGYEAGADAILDALKKDGWRLKGESVIPARGEFPEIRLEEKLKGWFFFIPDKEK